MKLIPIDFEQDKEKTEDLSFLDKLTGFFQSNIARSRQQKLDIDKRNRERLRKTAPDYVASKPQKPQVDAITRTARKVSQDAFDAVVMDNSELKQAFYETQYRMPFIIDDPKKRNPQSVEEFAQGFGSSWFIEPDVPASELNLPNRAARAAGYITGMGAMAVAISQATISGIISAPLLAVNNKRLLDAAKLYNQGDKILALEKSGIGIKGGGFFSKLNPTGPATKNLDRFFRNVESKGADTAKTLEFLRGGTREGMIWTSLGELSSDQEIEMDERISRMSLNFLAGGLFARSQYKYSQILSRGNTFVNKQGKEVIGYKPSQLFEPVATSAIAGAMSPMFHESTADVPWYQRALSAGITTGISRLASGFQFQTTRADVSRALQLTGVQDAQARALLSDKIMLKVHNQMPDLLKYYSGLEFKNEKGFVAKLKTIDTNKDSPAGQYSVVYDVYYPNGNVKQENVVSRSLDDFFKLYRTREYLDDIEPLKRGKERIVTLDEAGEEVVNEIPISTFNSEKDIMKLLENGKYGILSAQNGSNRVLIDAKPGYDYTDLLLEEILALGYNKKDILIMNSLVEGVYQPKVLVKGLKQNDGFELARKFGQDGFENQSGFVQINYTKGDNTKASNVKDVKIIRREPGMSMTTPTVQVQTRKGKQVKIVDDGEGGVKAEIKGEYIIDESQPIPGAAEFYTSRDGGRMRDHNIITLNNGNKVAFKMSYDFGKANPSNIPKSLINKFGDDIHSAAFDKSIIGGKDVNGLFLATRAADSDFGIEGAQARALKMSLFGKARSNQLTAQEHMDYQSLLYGIDSYSSVNHKYISRAYELNLNTKEDTTWGTLGSVIDEVGKVKDNVGNWILPMYRFWDYSSRKYNSPTMRKISYMMTEKVAETMRLKEEGRLYVQEGFEKQAKELGFSKSKLDNINMMALIMPEVFGPLSTLTKAEQKLLQPLVDEHIKFTKQAYKILKDYGVKELYINPKTKTRAWRDITEVENFMPLTVTDDIASVLNNNSSLKLQVLKDIQSDFARRGIKLTRAEAYEKFEQIVARSEKNGIYGTQFSRVFQLQPVYFLDEAGRVIPVTNPNQYKKKVGDTIGKSRTKIARRIESYNMKYIDSMNRYISRYANIAPNTKHFGFEGLYKNGVGKPGSVYGSEVTRLMNRMRLELSPSDFKYYKQYLESDLKELMGLNNQNPLGRMFTNVSNNLTGFTATAMLSGLVSPVKNFGLGSAQTYSTFGEQALARGGGSLIYDKSMYLAKGIRSEDLKNLELSGAKLSGQKIVDTATNNFLFESGQYGNLAQKGATIGMRLTEVGNRNISAYTGMQGAELALEVLKGNKKGLVTSHEQAVVNAERMLRETLRMSDESYYQLMSKKRYFDAQGNEIYLSVDDVDRAKGVMKEYKPGDKIGNKVIKEVVDDPQEFTDTQRIMIMSRAHSMTQGLTDAEYLPKIFNNNVLRPLTLFTRIATSVTDNVYNNVVRPAVEDGNVGNLLRYFGSSYANGAAIEYMYYDVLNSPREQFRTPMAVHMDRLLAGEIGGIYQIIAETTGRGGITSLANFQQAQAIGGFLGDSLKLGGVFITQQLYANEEVNPAQASFYELTTQEQYKAWKKSMSKLFAISNQLVQYREKQARPEYQSYRKFLKYQNDYRRNIQARPQEGRRRTDTSWFIEDKERFIYDIMEKEFYSDADINKVAIAVLAAVQIEADESLQEHQDRTINPSNVWDDAYKKVLAYNVNGLAPITLSKSRDSGVEGTDYGDFFLRLSDKDKQELKQVETFHKDRINQLKRALVEKKAQYRNAYISGLKDMEFDMGTIQIDL